MKKLFSFASAIALTLNLSNPVLSGEGHNHNHVEISTEKKQLTIWIQKKCPTASIMDDSKMSQCTKFSDDILNEVKDFWLSNYNLEVIFKEAKHDYMGWGFWAVDNEMMQSDVEEQFHRRLYGGDFSNGIYADNPEINPETDWVMDIDHLVTDSKRTYGGVASRKEKIFVVSSQLTEEEAPIVICHEIVHTVFKIRNHKNGTENLMNARAEESNFNIVESHDRKIKKAIKTKPEFNADTGG